MAEEKQPILLGLGRGYNGFYCPETRFHLVGVMRPQAHWPVDRPLTDDVKRALRGGTLVDVNGVLASEDVEFKVTESTPSSSSDRKKAQLLAKEEEQKQAQEDGTADEEGNPKKEQGELLSEPDIDEASAKDLKEFVKKNKLELEGINSRSNADELKEALKLHFGYIKAEEKDEE
jgi:hypothetical protein